MVDKDCKRDFYLVYRCWDPVEQNIDRLFRRIDKQLTREFLKELRIDNIEFRDGAGGISNEQCDKSD